MKGLQYLLPNARKKQTSNKFEEYRSAALIPECSSLLNDEIYPLYNIDEFYWNPWNSVEYDAEFFSKEASKLEEKLSKICATVSICDKNKDDCNSEQEQDVESFFSEINFQELNLEDISKSDVDERFLEVPQIPNSILQLKNEIAPEELLKNLSRMELPEIFKEKDVIFEDSAISFKDDSMVQIEEPPSLEDFENFEEIVLPMVTENDIKLEQLSNNFQNKVSSFHSESNQPHKTVNFVNLNENNKQFQKFDNTAESTLDSKDDVDFPSTFSKNNSLNARLTSRKTYNSSEKEDQLKNVPRTNEFESLMEKSHVFHDEFQEEFDENEYCNSDKFEYVDENISVVDDEDNEGKDDSSISVVCNDNISFVDDKTNKGNYDDSFSDVYDDDFFSENCVDFGSDIEDDQNMFSNKINESGRELNSNICHNPIGKMINLNIPQPADSESFLKKLSKLDLMKVERKINNDCVSEGNTGSGSILKGITAMRNTIQNFQQNEKRNEGNNMLQTLISQNIMHSDEDTKTAEKKARQVHSLRSFDLLSSYDYTRNKEADTSWSLNSSPSFSQKTTTTLDEKIRISLKNLEEFTHDNTSNNNERESLLANSEESNIHLPDEDLFVHLPDNYIQLILVYETAATYYIQRLSLWEGFQLSFDLTILDISLDTTRFLLNQEVKNCQDRNLSPLEGGITYSHYIQLLMLHGILKSMNCLIHFGAELALLSLFEFEKKHGILQGFFEDLIGQVSLFSERLLEAHSIHPKIEKMCLYLQEKYYYCKENIIPFKVLLIVKEHLVFFYSSFEAFMKTLLPEIIIDKIPECSIIEQEADKFSGCKEYIYVVRASSISKHVLWKELTLFVEYESDSNACWKTDCKMGKVAHVHIKFDSLPLKTVNEIKNLPPLKEPSFKTSVEVRKVPVVVSASISSKYNLPNLLSDMSDVCIYERSYKKYLPDMDFADITIDVKTCILIIDLISFLRTDTNENLIDKLFSLQLKYEVIWLIILNNPKNGNLNSECIYKIQTNYFKFYYVAATMKSLFSVKVKILFAKTDEGVANWITSILTRNLKCSLNEYENFHKYKLSDNMTEEELFLLSFPSLNPIATSFLLYGKTSLNHLMNLNLKELYARYQCIPGRFLKHFHSLIHKNIVHPSEPLEDNMIYSLKSDKISRDLQSQKSSSNASELVDFINCLEKYTAKENVKLDFSLEPHKNESSCKKTSTPGSYKEMTLEDIDRDYKVLKLQDIEYASFDVGFDIKSSSSDPSPSSTVTDDQWPRSTANSLKDEKNYNHSPPEDDLNLFVKESQKYALNESSVSRNTYRETELSVIPSIKYGFGNASSASCDSSLHYEEKNLCGDFKIQKLNLSQYKFKKRKSDSEMVTQNKFMKCSASQYSMFQTSPRLQKGQASKTVCKKVTFKSLSPTQFFEDKFSSSSSDSFQDTTSQLKTLKSFSQKPDSASYEKLDSSWLMQDKITLTPVENHKLTYEKVPGKKGQTRLVFHH